MKYSRSFVAVSGIDRIEFLQGIVTNNVKLVHEQLVYSAILTPQGKYFVDFFMVPRPDCILLDIDSACTDMLISNLKRYKLRSSVSIDSVEYQVVRGLGTQPENAFPDPRNKALGWRLYGKEDAVERPADWDHIRVLNCIPHTNIELIPNKTYILEAGFERLNGVDFYKGCYVGQEVTARMKHKTNLLKGLVTVGIDEKVREGTPVTQSHRVIGTIYTQSGNHAIAHLRFGRITDNELRAGNAKVTLM